MTNDKQTDHTAEKCVAIGEIAFSSTISPNNTGERSVLQDSGSSTSKARWAIGVLADSHYFLCRCLLRSKVMLEFISYYTKYC